MPAPSPSKLLGGTRQGMREVIVAAILAVLLALSGCSTLEPYDRDKIGIFNQCVEINSKGYGASGVTQLGPWYIGSWDLIWKRNIACDESLRIREKGVASRTPPAPVILK
jgi:hypothetical protein